MIETLVIRLLTGDQSRERGTDQKADWAVLDATGACVLPTATGLLGEAAALGVGRRVVVLVPALEVLRTRVEVPVKKTNRIAQLLPFALEDLLVEDVDELHFAPGARLADGQVPVAVVRRTLMVNWADQLDAAGIFPDALYAESDGVLDSAGTSTLFIDAQQVILRDPGGDAAVSGADGLPGLLELWLAQPRPEDTGALWNLQIYDASPAGWPGSTWDTLQERLSNLEVRRLADGALLRLAAGVISSPGINLLQGDYVRRRLSGGNGCAGGWQPCWWPC